MYAVCVYCVCVSNCVWNRCLKSVRNHRKRSRILISRDYSLLGYCAAWNMLIRLGLTDDTTQLDTENMTYRCGWRKKGDRKGESEEGRDRDRDNMMERER